MINKCNNKNCPGWLPTIIAGFIMFFTVMFSFIKDVNSAEMDENSAIRVEIKRELPNKDQEIVQQFFDYESFQFWMEDRLAQKCDPYVTEVKIKINNRKEDQ